MAPIGQTPGQSAVDRRAEPLRHTWRPTLEQRRVDAQRRATTTVLTPDLQPHRVASYSDLATSRRALGSSSVIDRPSRPRPTDAP